MIAFLCHARCRAEGKHASDMNPEQFVRALSLFADRRSCTFIFFQDKQSCSFTFPVHQRRPLHWMNPNLQQNLMDFLWKVWEAHFLNSPRLLCFERIWLSRFCGWIGWPRCEEIMIQEIRKLFLPAFLLWKILILKEGLRLQGLIHSCGTSVKPEGYWQSIFYLSLEGSWLFCCCFKLKSLTVG